MQIPPVTLDNLIVLFALSAIILLITAELASSYNGLSNLTINKKKLRNAALSMSVLFLITTAIRMILVITTS